jgi:hypothetical protein
MDEWMNGWIVIINFPAKKNLGLLATTRRGISTRSPKRDPDSVDLHSEPFNSLILGLNSKPQTTSESCPKFSGQPQPRREFAPQQELNMPNFTFANLRQIYEKYRDASKVIHAAESNAGVIEAKKYLAKESRKIGWEALQSNLECKTCQAVHFRDGKRPQKRRARDRGAKVCQKGVPGMEELEG